MSQLYFYAGRLYTICWITITKDGVRISVKYLSPIAGGKRIEFSYDLNIEATISVSARIYSILFNIYSDAVYHPESCSFPTFPELILILASDSDSITEVAGVVQNSLPVVVSFKDLHITANLELAKASLKGLSGIYCFRHIASGKIYIGQAVDLSVRIIQHLNGLSSNILLQRALKKYGLAAFEFIVMEFVKDTSLLTTREQLHLDWLFSLSSEFRYNILSTASSLLGYTHTAETKAAMIGNTNRLGTTHTAETRAAMSASHLGLTHTAETIDLIRLNHPNRKSVFVYDLNNKLLGEYLSLRDTAKFLEVSHITVRNYLASGKPLKGQYILRTSPLS